MSNITWVDVRYGSDSAVGNHSMLIYSHISLVRVSLKAIFCAELLHSATDPNLKLTVLTAEPKPPLLIPKRHFRLVTKEHWVASLKADCVTVLWSRDWLSDHDYLHLIQHSFFRSILYSPRFWWQHLVLFKKLVKLCFSIFQFKSFVKYIRNILIRDVTITGLTINHDKISHG